MTHSQDSFRANGLGVTITVEHDWSQLGYVLAAQGTNIDQVRLLDTLSGRLHVLGFAGDLQLQHIADEINGEPEAYGKVDVVWLLRGLLDRLEES